MPQALHEPYVARNDRFGIIESLAPRQYHGKGRHVSDFPNRRPFLLSGVWADAYPGTCSPVTIQDGDRAGVFHMRA